MEPENKLPILELAWTRFAHFDAAAGGRNKSHMLYRRRIALLGILATLFAVLTQLFSSLPVFPGSAILELILKILFVATPITASAMAAFTNWFLAKAIGW